MPASFRRHFVGKTLTCRSSGVKQPRSIHPQVPDTHAPHKRNNAQAVCGILWHLCQAVDKSSGQTKSVDLSTVHTMEQQGICHAVYQLKNPYNQGNNRHDSHTQRPILALGRKKPTTVVAKSLSRQAYINHQLLRTQLHTPSRGSRHRNQSSLVKT